MLVMKKKKKKKKKEIYKKKKKKKITFRSTSKFSWYIDCTYVWIALNDTANTIKVCWPWHSMFMIVYFYTLLESNGFRNLIPTIIKHC